MRILVFLSALLAFAPGLAFAQATQPLALDARLTEEGEVISNGLTWRIFSSQADSSGKHQLIANGEGGAMRFNLLPGSYLVHAAYGRAGATKQIEMGAEPLEETVLLRAGGLQVSANTGDSPIDPEKLVFSIYDVEQDASGNRKLIALNVKANSIVRLNEGIYHVLSRYGDINATVRADLQVRAGEVTRAELLHRGAEVDLRLVSREGGPPIASTQWTILTADGAKVFSSNSISPQMVLAEGEYEVNVRNGERVYRKVFNVKAGDHTRIEVRLDEDAV
jgi:hypothetical protein